MDYLSPDAMKITYCDMSQIALLNCLLISLDSEVRNFSLESYVAR